MLLEPRPAIAPCARESPGLLALTPSRPHIPNDQPNALKHIPSVDVVRARPRSFRRPYRDLAGSRRTISMSDTRPQNKGMGPREKRG